MENVQNVILVVHLVLALLLIGVVLLQRSARAGKGISVIDTTPAEAPASTGTAPLISAPPPSTDAPVVPPVLPPAATEAPAEAPAATETPAPEAPASN